MIEVHHVVPGESSSTSAGRAVSRLGNKISLLLYHRTHFLIKIPIDIGHLKPRLALLADWHKPIIQSKQPLISEQKFTIMKPYKTWYANLAFQNKRLNMRKRAPKSLISSARIEGMIYVIRGQKVILDTDLANLYEVKTKRLNEQVKRNFQRFPPQFMFQLTTEEKIEVVAKCDHLRNLRFSKTNPYAFTEHGALMAANVLKSERAIAISIQVIQAFIQIRQFINSHTHMTEEINALKTFVLKNTQKTTQEFRKVWRAIEKLSTTPTNEEHRIGFDNT